MVASLTLDMGMFHVIYYSSCFPAGLLDATLEQLLVMVTGSSTIPPLGFDPQPRVVFRDEGVAEYERGFPYVSTCDNLLAIPAVRSYRPWKEAMLGCINGLQTFSNV